MKKFKNYLWIAIAILAGTTALASCNDEDDNRPHGGGASAIVGVYNGEITATVMNINCEINGTYDLTITRGNNENDEVTVVLPSVTYSTEGMQRQETIPALIVPEVDVDRLGHDADMYYLEEDDFTVVVDGVKYTGGIHGTISKSQIDLVYSIIPGQMPMPINFTFKGTLK